MPEPISIQIKSARAKMHRDAVNPPGGSKKEITYKDGEDMFAFIDRVAYKKNRIREKHQREEIAKECVRGEELLKGILKDPDNAVSDSLIQHAKDIRAVTWALYKKSFDKKQAFIGGMIVLEDGGNMAKYLMKGPCVSNQSMSDEIMKDPKAQYVPYYNRRSTHFGKRRDNSMGMDFYRFTDHSGEKPQKRKDIKLPLEKSTLHFGTLDKGLLTFLKFEYYGTLTVGKKAQHSMTLLEKWTKPEIGNREDGVPIKFQVGIQLLLEKYGAGKGLKTFKYSVPGKFFDKKIELEKEGAYFAQVVILNKVDEKKREAALLELKDLIDRQEGMPTDHGELRQGSEVIFSKEDLGA